MTVGSLNNETSNPEVPLTPDVNVQESHFSEELITELQDRINLYRQPKSVILPKVWEVTGDSDKVKETLEGLRTLMGFVSRTINLGGPFDVATYDPGRAEDSNSTHGFLYCYAAVIDPETAEISRQYLVRETNNLLNQLQSPHRLCNLQSSSTLPQLRCAIILTNNKAYASI